MKIELKMKVDTACLVKHAYDLAAAFGIDLLLFVEQPPDLAAAVHHPDGIRKGVIAKTITDETSYAVVLHEMGHLLSPLGYLRGPLGVKEPSKFDHPRDRHRWMNLRLEEEQAAWEWARHYSLVWTLPMQMVEQQAYATYIQAKERTR